MASKSEILKDLKHIQFELQKVLDKNHCCRGVSYVTKSIWEIDIEIDRIKSLDSLD